jgi:hypothetical protein
MLISDYICNWRREDGDAPSPRLRFGFEHVSNLCFLRSDRGGDNMILRKNSSSDTNY